MSLESQLTFLILGGFLSALLLAIGYKFGKLEGEASKSDSDSFGETEQ